MLEASNSVRLPLNAASPLPRQRETILNFSICAWRHMAVTWKAKLLPSFARISLRRFFSLFWLGNCIFTVFIASDMESGRQLLRTILAVLCIRLLFRCLIVSFERKYCKSGEDCRRCRSVPVCIENGWEWLRVAGNDWAGSRNSLFGSSQLSGLEILAFRVGDSVELLKWFQFKVHLGWMIQLKLVSF